MKRPPNLMAIAIPTVLTVAAVYIALFFASRLTNRLFDADKDEDRNSMRPVDTSEMPPLFIEQPPPPSPELVAERVRRELEATREQRLNETHPLLDEDLERTVATPERQSLRPLDLPPLPVALPTTLRTDGNAPPGSAEAD